MRTGENLRQDKLVGSIHEIFQRFANEWTKRWDRHLGQNDEQWEPLLAFFRQSVPPGMQMQHQPTTAEEWYAALKSKKRTAAVGPDGWARQDLLRMPLPLVRSL